LGLIRRMRARLEDRELIRRVARKLIKRMVAIRR
jgi:hypothetical protein